MKYLFKFNYFLFDLHYINRTIELFPPWTYFISIGSCILYLILIRTVFPLYKSKFAQQSFAIVHYGLLCFYSLVACLTVFFYLIQTNEIIHWSELLCSPIPSWLRILSISFTLSKIWEWFDTAILIAKGHSLSKIGFLHIYHHATTFVLFLSIMNLPGSEKTGILFNGFVHALMYYHFAFRLPKICRPVITTLQIIQLLTSIYIWYSIPNVCHEYKHFPRENFFEYILPYTLVPVYCLFFFKFFLQQYLFVSSKKIE